MPVEIVRTILVHVRSHIKIGITLVWFHCINCFANQFKVNLFNYFHNGCVYFRVNALINYFERWAIASFLEMKVISLLELIPKKFLDPFPTPNSLIGPKKAQSNPQKAKDQKVRKQKILQNESYQTTWFNLRPYRNPKIIK